MAHQEPGHIRMPGVTIRGLLKRIFIGSERAVEMVLPGKMSPIRQGRGMPAAYEAPVASGATKHRSDGPAVWSQFGADAQGGARAFVVGSHVSGGRMKNLARDFSLRGLGVDFCNDFEETLKSIAVSPQRWNLLVVDVDHVERSLDIEDIVNELVLFREQYSSIAIVLLSHSFATDDSDLIRSAIADHSFRASVGAEVIYEALPQIFANNRSWVQRREALQDRDPVIIPFPRGDVT